MQRPSWMGAGARGLGSVAALGARRFLGPAYTLGQAPAKTKAVATKKMLPNAALHRPGSKQHQSRERWLGVSGSVPLPELGTLASHPYIWVLGCCRATA